MSGSIHIEFAFPGFGIGIAAIARNKLLLLGIHINGPSPPCYGTRAPIPKASRHERSQTAKMAQTLIEVAR